MKLDDFEQLARLASEEIPSSTYVEDRVLVTLRASVRALAGIEPECVLFGYGSIAAACAALLLFAISAGDDSLIMLVEPFITVRP